MAEMTPRDMAGCCCWPPGSSAGWSHGHDVEQSIADTPMVVTLDQLRPTTTTPASRATRPCDEIRRPSANADWMRPRRSRAGPRGALHHFATAVIRGLAILARVGPRPSKRFFRRLFRPWPEQGESSPDQATWPKTNCAVG